MSRKFLPMLLAVALVAMGFSFAAKADVSGAFTFWIVMEPQTTSGETTPMNFDFEAELDLDVTISGLTFGNQLTFGVGGIEHYVATLQATLGALDIKDEFVFATPYYGVHESYWGYWWFFSYIHPKYGEVGGVRRGELMFLTKRVSSSISLGGVTFDNLFMLEDINFPDVNDPDPGVDYQTQQFAVGDIITISGETPSGVRVQGITALCADLFLYSIYPKHQLLKIFELANTDPKKLYFNKVVEDDCYGFGVDTADGGFKPAFAFTKEVLSISNIPLPSGITVDTVGVFSSVPYIISPIYPVNCPAFATWCNIKLRPAQIPFFVDTVIQVPVAGLADVLIELYTSNPDHLFLDKLVLTFQLPEHGWVVHWYDNNGDLTFTVDDDIVFKGGLSFQDAVALNSFVALTPTVGIWLAEIDVQLPISWPEPYGTLELLFNWCDNDNGKFGCFPGPPDGSDDGIQGTLDFQYWAVRMVKEFSHNTFEFRARFDKYSFAEAAFIGKVTFDI